MSQTITAEDARYLVVVNTDHPTVINFYSGLLTAVIGEVDALHKMSPVLEVFIRAITPGPIVHKLTVKLVDGRQATYNFYAGDLSTYTLNIDGAPWHEIEALKLPGIRNAMVLAHNSWHCTSFKLTYKAVV